MRFAKRPSILVRPLGVVGAAGLLLAACGGGYTIAALTPVASSVATISPAKANTVESASSASTGPIPKAALDSARTPTTVEAWARVSAELDEVWSRDWPQAIRLIDNYRSQYPNSTQDATATNKLYAALLAYGQELLQAGKINDGIQQLARARALLPGAAQAEAALAALTPTPPPAASGVVGPPAVPPSPSLVAAAASSKPLASPPSPASSAKVALMSIDWRNPSNGTWGPKPSTLTSDQLSVIGGGGWWWRANFALTGFTPGSQPEFGFGPNPDLLTLANPAPGVRFDSSGAFNFTFQWAQYGDFRWCFGDTDGHKVCALFSVPKPTTTSSG